MVRLLVILGIFSIYAENCNADKTNKTHKLINTIRRQLMEDNYNYMESGESEQLTTQPPDQLPVIRAQDLDLSGSLDEEYHIQKKSTNQQKSHDHLEPKFQALDNEQPAPKTDHFEDHFEPLIDLSHRVLRYSNLYNEHFQNNQHKHPAGESTTTVQYELLEIAAKPDMQGWARWRSGRRRGGRRSGGGGVRRFLQEEKPDQIAIVPLDQGPIPEFRLPRGRRQFMGGLDLSDEQWPTIPPLPGDIIGYMTDSTPPPVKRRYRAPQPDTEASEEIETARNRLKTSVGEDLETLINQI
ncbi:hypothetical protein O0L34_g18942 [Tuta absoluta]|nr:hypothetical protein O0L34_g18942 [Tuta absoluta]